MMNEDNTTDKDGKPVDEQVTWAMERLENETNCLVVMCAWHKTGRLQFWSKSSTVGRRAFEVAEETGYVPDVAGSRRQDGRKRGYVEFVQEGER